MSNEKNQDQQSSDEDFTSSLVEDWEGQKFLERLTAALLECAEVLSEEANEPDDLVEVIPIDSQEGSETVTDT